jgi:hypothetical protein
MFLLLKLSGRNAGYPTVFRPRTRICDGTRINIQRGWFILANPSAAVMDSNMHQTLPSSQKKNIIRSPPGKDDDRMHV